MTEMKRFDVAGCSGYCNGGYHMKEDVDGEYVTYESHVEAMKSIAGDGAQQEPMEWQIEVAGPAGYVRFETFKGETLEAALDSVRAQNFCPAPDEDGFVTMKVKV